MYIIWKKNICIYNITAETSENDTNLLSGQKKSGSKLYRSNNWILCWMMLVFLMPSCAHPIRGYGWQYSMRFLSLNEQPSVFGHLTPSYHSLASHFYIFLSLYLWFFSRILNSVLCICLYFLCVLHLNFLSLSLAWSFLQSVEYLCEVVYLYVYVWQW